MNTIATATMPANSISLRSPRGKEIGTRYFIGTRSASQLKDAGKALGMKGAALKDWVNAALTDEAAARSAGLAATVSALGSAGFVGDTVDVRKSTATIRLVKPAEASAKVSKMAALEAEIAELRAMLAAKAA